MGKPSAFILDDDPNFLRYFSLFLDRQGFETKSFTDISEFLEGAEKAKPKAFFVDLNIHKIGDGFSVMESLVKSVEESQPIFIVSSSSDTNSLFRAVSLGATDYLIKPISKTLLLKKIFRHLGTRDPSQEMLPLLPATSVGTGMAVEVDFDVSGIDETGVTLTGKHYIPTGQVIAVKSDLLKEIGGTDQSHLVTLLRSDAEASAGEFTYYAAFNPSDVEFLNSVRRWLLIRKNENL